MWEPSQSQAYEVARRLIQMAERISVVRVVSNGWIFGYAKPCEDLPGIFKFSAQLQPLGRGSTEEDWEFLGHVMGALGIPLLEGPSRFILFTDAAVAHPNSMLKWSWTELADDHLYDQALVYGAPAFREEKNG